jgi:hypothetical protein
MGPSSGCLTVHLLRGQLPPAIPHGVSTLDEGNESPPTTGPPGRPGLSRAPDTVGSVKNNQIPVAHDAYVRARVPVGTCSPNNLPPGTSVDDEVAVRLHDGVRGSGPEVRRPGFQLTVVCQDNRLQTSMRSRPRTRKGIRGLLRFIVTGLPLLPRLSFRRAAIIISNRHRPVVRA